MSIKKLVTNNSLTTYILIGLITFRFIYTYYIFLINHFSLIIDIFIMFTSYLVYNKWKNDKNDKKQIEKCVKCFKELDENNYCSSCQCTFQINKNSKNIDDSISSFHNCREMLKCYISNHQLIDIFMDDFGKNKHKSCNECNIIYTTDDKGYWKVDEGFKKILKTERKFK